MNKMSHKITTKQKVIAKLNNEEILDKIVRADGKHLIYYRNCGSYPTDVKTRVEND